MIAVTVEINANPVVEMTRYTHVQSRMSVTEGWVCDGRGLTTVADEDVVGPVTEGVQVGV